MARLRFQRAARLVSAGDFARTRKNGKSAQKGLLRLTVSAAATPGESSRFGLVTSRRVGPAVMRNKVRRRLREIIRASRPKISTGWHVVTTAKPASAHASFHQLQDEWLLLAARLSILHKPL